MIYLISFRTIEGGFGRDFLETDDALTPAAIEAFEARMRRKYRSAQPVTVLAVSPLAHSASTLRPVPVGDVECAEGRSDARGDCDGEMLFVEFRTNLGSVETRAGEHGYMCSSHASQARKAHEVEIISRAAAAR